MAKTFSGKRMIHILCHAFGFFIVSQKGSHVKLRRTAGRKVLTVIIPLHRELATGTWQGVLEMAEISEEEFWRRVR